MRLGLTRRPVLRLLSAMKMRHTRAHSQQIEPRCPPYHPCGCFPGAHFPKSDFGNTTERGGERRERKEKEGRRERGEREKRRQQTNPLNGSSALREGSDHLYFLRTILLRRRRIFAVFLARKCSKQNAYKSCFIARRWRNLPILNWIWPPSHGI